MLYVILALIMGFFLGCGLTLKLKSSDDSKSTKYLRRGILQQTFQVTNVISGTHIVSVQFEVGEIERTSSKSKIQVLSTTPSESKFSSESDKNGFKNLINLTWMDSNLFEWIEDDISEKRAQKIDEILS